MIDRESIRRFLIAIGHEAASNDQPSLCLVEDVVRALGEVTPKMYTAGEVVADNGSAAQYIYAEMFAARFRGE